MTHKDQTRPELLELVLITQKPGKVFMEFENDLIFQNMMIYLITLACIYIHVAPQSVHNRPSVWCNIDLLTTSGRNPLHPIIAQWGKNMTPTSGWDEWTWKMERVHRVHCTYSGATELIVQSCESARSLVCTKISEYTGQNIQIFSVQIYHSILCENCI